jgi:hypothetical protein
MDYHSHHNWMVLLMLTGLDIMYQMMMMAFLEDMGIDIENFHRLK